MHLTLDRGIARRNALLHTSRDVDPVPSASVVIKLWMCFANFSRNDAE
jgi:hypothetical protein